MFFVDAAEIVSSCCPCACALDGSTAMEQLALGKASVSVIVFGTSSAYITAMIIACSLI